MGGIFLLRELHLENFMSRPDLIPTFCQRRCTNRGRNFVRSKRRSTYTSSTTSTYFYALTIRKQLPGNDFERSGRGQEPSRGHKFSILENVVLHWDFTSQTLTSFPSDLVGACLPQTLLGRSTVNWNLSGQSPSILLCKTVLSLKSPTGAFIVLLRSTNANFQISLCK